MDDHKYIKLMGEVIFRGSPVKIPGKYYDSTFFTIKITIPTHTSEGYSFIEDYFNIHTFKAEQIYKIKEGYIVSCVIRRDSKLWIKENKPVFKYNYRGNVNHGKYPVIFESYHLVSDIKILDDSINKEKINQANQNFQHFLDENS